MRCILYEIEFERIDIPIFCGALVVEDSTVIIHPWDQFIHANTNGISHQDGSFSSDVLIKFDLCSFYLLFIQIVPIAAPSPVNQLVDSVTFSACT